MFDGVFPKWKCPSIPNDRVSIKVWSETTPPVWGIDGGCWKQDKEMFWDYLRIDWPISSGRAPSTRIQDLNIYWIVSFWHAKVMRQDLLVVVWGCWFAVLGKALQVIKNPFHFIHQRCQITSTSDVTALNVWCFPGISAQQMAASIVEKAVFVRWLGKNRSSFAGLIVPRW